MKVVHICLCGPVTDGWNYQDNMLTKYHRKMGNEVTIITCKSIWGKNGVLEKDTRSNYINENDIKVIRLENRIGRDVTSKFKVYKSLYKSIENEKPDILFIHGVAFLDVITIRKYLKKNNIARFAEKLTATVSFFKAWDFFGGCTRLKRSIKKPLSHVISVDANIKSAYFGFQHM